MGFSDGEEMSLRRCDDGEDLSLAKSSLRGRVLADLLSLHGLPYQAKLSTVI